MMTWEQTLKITGENVRRLRISHRLSITALAEACDVCPNIIRRIEKGKSNTRTDTLYKIAGYFGVEVYELQMPIPKARMPENHKKAVQYLRKSIAYQQAAARYFVKVMETDDNNRGDSQKR